jgi:carboxylesterase type B
MYVDKTMDEPAAFRNFWAELLPALSSEDLDTIEALYPDPSTQKDSPYIETRTDHGLGAQYKRTEAAYAHYAYVAPVRQTAEFASRQNPGSVYLYHWALPRTVVGGANHADNMYYETYNSAITGISEVQKRLSGVLHAYLTSFIVAGDPNAVRGGLYGDRPVWGVYEVDKPKALVFGEGIEELVGGENRADGIVAEFVDDTWARGKTGETEFWWGKVEVSQVA